ncbi:nitronate monooxygenase [Niallia sp. Man26]|uniref:NAD(P)H-dependent flavin oxidoreductase n=1 Tax=Niallia sp. Man26 TaxID=2912824 RepID=UPI001ED9E0ED|nr:nitronate monooxygenase [Niallia sp. Man26]UPO90758.1 nitronate monooxygenase [Niallia sp. Man26]
MQNNRVTNILGIELPIIQAPMSWITNATMVAAVSNAGGMGVLGPNAGAKDIDSKDLNMEEMLRNQIRKVRNLTDKPFALNILSPPEGVEDQFTQITLQVGFEEGVKHYASVGNVNRDIFNLVKENGGIVLHRELTPSPEAAKQAEEAGADIIIATGYDEGGILPQNQIGTFSIVPTIVDAVNIPVMATGGINDIRGVRAAFSLGAEGVYMGTRFIVSDESPVSELTKKDIINSKGSDLLFISASQRSTAHKFSKELAEFYKDGVPSAELDKKASQNGGLRTGMLEGNLDKGIISVNTAIDLITEVKSCRDIIIEVMADFINK